MPSTESTRLSVVLPLYNEEENFPDLVEALGKLKTSVSPVELEFILVDDGSCDKTFEKGSSIASADPSFTIIKLARNYGSHAAIAAGMSLASGDCAIFMAGDLQDPPALIPTMLEHWRSNYKIVWAGRQEGVKQSGSGLFSSLYWSLFNFVVAYPVQAAGVDFALIDRAVINVLKARAHLVEPIFAQITDSGFGATLVNYDKAPRAKGKSGWTLKKKLNLVMQTLTYSLKSFRFLCFLGMLLTVFSMASFLALAFLLFSHSWILAGAATTVVLFHSLVLTLWAAWILFAELIFGKLKSPESTRRFQIEAVCRASDS